MSEIRRKSTSNAQAKHHWANHPTEEHKFTTRIISGVIKCNFERYIREALNVESAKGNQNINMIKKIRMGTLRGNEVLQIKSPQSMI